MPNKSLGIDFFKSLAKARNHVLLSDAYQNLDATFLEVKCRVCSYEWSPLARNYKRPATGCPHCQGKIYSQDEIKKWTTDCGYMYLNQIKKKFNRLRTHIYVQCQNCKTKAWKDLTSLRRYKKKCPCSAGNRRITLKQYREMATDRGGSCLGIADKTLKSEINQKTAFWWKCGISTHKRWKQVGSIIWNGSWCPECGKRKSYCESLTRRIIEKALKIEFPTDRVPWMRGKRGAKLELDGYNEKAQIAFEHQSSRYHTNNPHDEIKRQETKKRGIKLIEVWGSVPVEVDFKSQIIKEFERLDIIPVVDINSIKIKNRELFLPKGADQFKRLKAVVDKKNGIILQDAYWGASVPLQFQCDRNHPPFEKMPKVIFDDAWCDICKKEDVGMTLEAAQLLANAKGGTCLSTEISRDSARVHWKCSSCDNNWYATYNSIKKGWKWNWKTKKWIRNNKISSPWCPQCANIRTVKKLSYDLNEIQEYALSLGGTCLSKFHEYKNVKSLLLWQCGKQHTPFRRSFDKVKNAGQWCSICRNLGS